MGQITAKKKKRNKNVRKRNKQNVKSSLTSFPIKNQRDSFVR